MEENLSNLRDYSLRLGAHASQKGYTRFPSGNPLKENTKLHELGNLNPYWYETRSKAPEISCKGSDPECKQ
jgi:hypothetical protein